MITLFKKIYLFPVITAIILFSQIVLAREITYFYDIKVDGSEDAFKEKNIIEEVIRVNLVNELNKLSEKNVKKIDINPTLKKVSNQLNLSIKFKISHLGKDESYTKDVTMKDNDDDMLKKDVSIFLKSCIDFINQKVDNNNSNRIKNRNYLGSSQSDTVSTKEMEEEKPVNGKIKLISKPESCHYEFPSFFQFDSIEEKADTGYVFEKINFSYKDSYLIKLIDKLIELEKTGDVEMKYDAWDSVYKDTSSYPAFNRIAENRVSKLKEIVGQKNYNKLLANPMRSCIDYTESDIESIITYLNRFKKNHPRYTQHADQRINELKDCNEQQKKQNACFVDAVDQMYSNDEERNNALAGDFSMLLDCLSLKNISNDEKRGYVKSFLESYGAINEINPHLKALNDQFDGIASSHEFDDIKDEQMNGLKLRLNMLLISKKYLYLDEKKVKLWSTIPIELINSLPNHQKMMANIPNSHPWHAYSKQIQKYELHKSEIEDAFTKLKDSYHQLVNGKYPLNDIYSINTLEKYINELISNILIFVSENKNKEFKNHREQDVQKMISDLEREKAGLHIKRVDIEFNKLALFESEKLINEYDLSNKISLVEEFIDKYKSHHLGNHNASKAKALLERLIYLKKQKHIEKVEQEWDNIKNKAHVDTNTTIEMLDGFLNTYDLHEQGNHRGTDANTLRRKMQKKDSFEKNIIHIDPLPLLRMIYSYCPQCSVSKKGVGLDWQLGFHFLKFYENLISIGLYADTALIYYPSNESNDRSSLHFQFIPALKLEHHVPNNHHFVYFGATFGIGYHGYKENVLIKQNEYLDYTNDSTAYKTGLFIGYRSYDRYSSLFHFKIDLLGDFSTDRPKSKDLAACASCLYQVNPIHIQFGIAINLLGLSE